MHVVCLHLFCLALRILCIMLLTATDEGCMLNIHPDSDCSDISQKRKPSDLTLRELYFFLPKKKRNVIVFSILCYHLGLLNEPCMSYKSCSPSGPPHTVLFMSI